MPKLLMLSHLTLLFVLSVLLFPAGINVVATEPKSAVPSAVLLAVLAVALSGVLALTEVFSGVRWPPILAFVTSATALVEVCRGAGQVPAISIWAWAIAWLAVATWFAILAGRERRNR